MTTPLHYVPYTAVHPYAAPPHRPGKRGREHPEMYPQSPWQLFQRPGLLITPEMVLTLLPHPSWSVPSSPQIEAVSSGVPSVTVPKAMHHKACPCPHGDFWVWKQSPEFRTPESSFHGFVIHFPSPQK